MIIGLIFVIQYFSVQHIADLFCVSNYSISKCLDEILPRLANFFISFVPNSFEKNEKSSSLSELIVGIVDCTLHKICKPNVDQRLFYNGHYKMHGILTQILINFYGKIIGFITNVPGKINDALIAIYAEFFRDVLKGRFALGDPGFAGVDWVVCGLRYKQKTLMEHFYLIRSQDQSRC